MVNICCLCVNISYCYCIITVYPYCIYFLSLLACNLRDSLSWTSTWVGVVFYSALRKLHSQQISFSYSYHLKSLLSHFVSTWVMTYKLSEMIIVTKSKFSFYYFHGGGGAAVFGLHNCIIFLYGPFPCWLSHGIRCEEAADCIISSDDRCRGCLGPQLILWNTR